MAIKPHIFGVSIWATRTRDLCYKPSRLSRFSTLEYPFVGLLGGVRISYSPSYRGCSVMMIKNGKETKDTAVAIPLSSNLLHPLCFPSGSLFTWGRAASEAREHKSVRSTRLVVNYLRSSRWRAERGGRVIVHDEEPPSTTPPPSTKDEVSTLSSDSKQFLLINV